MATGTDVNRVVYGCMGLGGAWDDSPVTAADVEQAEAAVAAAVESGITVFDHADIYRRGKAERVFGEVLARDRGLRERITLQTKVGIRLAEPGRVGHYDLRAERIERGVAESLERLRTDVLDVLLLHRPDPLADPDEIAGALESVHRQGLVRRVGVSNMGAPQIAALQARLSIPVVVNQVEMSLGARDWVEAGVLVNTPAAAANGFPFGLLEHCAATGVRLQAWGALAGGRYTGLAESPAELAASEVVARLAKEKGTTGETIVLWWLTRHPARIEAVIGTSRPERIRACRDAVTREAELSHEEWYELWVAARGERLP
ncbi:aldo/keto reductase [Streptomyces sp. BI20]|uniref:aldo/keto reductase n=1 Tax=Streptomyces sp. BI20 TaxID=3403460 RepID=UPI003C774882